MKRLTLDEFKKKEALNTKQLKLLTGQVLGNCTSNSANIIKGQSSGQPGTSATIILRG